MIEKWLTSADLGHLTERFSAQQIGYADLTELTDEHLAELGLTIGERLRFRRALATGVASIVSSERRPLTLAFFDLVGSASLCEEIDVEDMVEVLRQYREICSIVIDKFGGHVAHLLGDGILAYFCYPVAHENDAERAVRAALEICGNIGTREYPPGRRLAVRSGIATGRVVVTELSSGRAADKHSVTGSTPNLAARLQSLAPPNGIVLSEATARLVGHLFDLEDLGEQKLKGFAEPLQMFRVRRERRQPRAPGKTGPHTLTPYVGRADQRRALLAEWDRVQAGVGQVVVLTGDAGIGKSRTVEQFLIDSGAGTDDVVRLFGSPFDEHSPLEPFLGYLRQLAGHATSRETLAQSLGSVIPHAEDGVVEALADFLGGIANSNDEGGAIAEKRRALALRGLTQHLEARASRHALRLVVEDAHWFDASSRDLLAQLIMREPRPSIMLVLTSRTRLAEIMPAVEPSRVVELALQPFAQRDISEMVRAAFRDEPVAGEIVRWVADHSDGVPLFVEEILRPLMHSNLSAGLIAAGESRPPAVPATLHEALAARLDRLGPEKEVAQVAAVVGRSVNPAHLARVLGATLDRVSGHLDVLCSAGILRQQSDAAETTFAFSHALIRDAAYDSLLRGRRQMLHARIADVLLNAAPGPGGELPQTVAMHLTEGGRLEEALPYWLAAGRAAAARSALLEARYVLERGAAIAANLPQTPDVLKKRLELASLLGPVVFALSGPGSEESHAIYEQAVALTELVPEGATYFAVLWWWWRLTPDFRLKGKRARMLMRLANRRQDSELRLQAHHCNWGSSSDAGDYSACRYHIEEGLKAYALPDCQHRPWMFGNHDAKVCAHGILAQTMWMQGHLKDARVQERRCLGTAKRLGHAGTLAHAFDLALLHRYYSRDVEGMRRLAERMIALAEESGMAENRARGQLFAGWAMAHQGEPALGAEVFEAAYRRQLAVGTNEDTPMYACMFAEILDLLNQHERALGELEGMPGEMVRIGVFNWLPEVWRMIGETTRLARPTDREAALRAFRISAEIGASQGTRMLEVRNLLSMSALLEGADRQASVGHLEALLHTVEPCPKSIDLRRANEFLASLRPSLRPAL